MLNTKYRIALIAHDGKKAEMRDFVQAHADLLQQAQLFATATTGTHIEAAGLKVEKKLSGPAGGDAQIAALAAEGLLDVIIFFRDPLGKHPHEPDIQMLMRICDVHSVPLATNMNSAKLILRGLFFAKEY